MPTRSITLAAPVMEKINSHAKAKRIKVSDYLRQLIDLGLRVEEASNKGDGEKENNDEIVLELQKKVLQSVIESLIINRSTMMSLGQLSAGKLDPAQTEEILTTAKQKAEGFVDGFFKKML